MQKLLCVILILFFTACSLTQSKKEVSVDEILPTQVIKPKDLSQIALIVPQKTIKSYSSIVINSSLAYLLKQSADIRLKIILTDDEKEENLAKALKEIEDENIAFVIAAVTINGAAYLTQNAEDMVIYMPLVHKKAMSMQAGKNIYFGSIDYEAQIQKLLEFSGDDIASFYSDMTLSSFLNQKILDLAPNAKIRLYRVPSQKPDYARILKSQGSLDGASVFLNTPLITSAILSSQLRVHDYEVNSLLLTQLGYSPVLLNLTQSADRKTMLIANSIDNQDDELSFLNEIFVQNLDYNWVAYATSVGLDYFYANLLNPKANRLFKEEIIDSQVIYKITLMRALDFSFAPLEIKP